MTFSTDANGNTRDLVGNKVYFSAKDRIVLIEPSGRRFIAEIDMGATWGIFRGTLVEDVNSVELKVADSVLSDKVLALMKEGVASMGNIPCEIC